VLSGEATATPKDRTGVIEAIRVLRVARAGAVKARTAVLNQRKDVITTMPDELRTQLRGQRLVQVAKTGARMRPDTTRMDNPVHATKTALPATAARVLTLTDEIATADKRLKALLTPQRTPHDGPTRDVHPACRATTDHRRAQPHPTAQRVFLRRPLRSQPDSGQQRQDQPPPSQP